jgi:hypothetical protein
VPDVRPLPMLPLLRPWTPVLQRGADAVQVGLDPDRAVVLRGHGPRRLLDATDGGHDLPALHEVGRAAGLAAQDVDTVLATLHRAGLLVDGAGAAAAPAYEIRLVGAGVVARQLTGLLLDAGLDLHVAELGGVAGAPSLRPEPDRGELRPSGRGRCRRVGHWSKPDRDDLALTVVAVDTAEADRGVTDHLLRTDQPHLLVRSAGTSVTVGPLVLPGRSACLRCCDLARRDADPAWPRLLPQLTRLRQPSSGVLTAWAAAVAAAQVLAHLCGAVPESVGATLELDGADHLMRRRSWPLHPACGCAWSGTTEWAP